MSDSNFGLTLTKQTFFKKKIKAILIKVAKQVLLLILATGKCYIAVEQTTHECVCDLPTSQNFLKGVLHRDRYQKLACFVLYLKIINTFLKNDVIMHLLANCPMNSK